MDDKRLRSVWHNMKTRCYNPNSNIYKWYGGRGICVYQEWQTYSKFREWALAHGYADNLTLDRIDSDGDYCPENCRFVSMRQNCNNKRDNHVVEYNGLKLTLSEWAELTGLEYMTLYSRIHLLGWSFQKAITEPVQQHKRNKRNTIAEYAREHGVLPDTVRKRISRQGRSLEEAVNPPLRKSIGV